MNISIMPPEPIIEHQQMQIVEPNKEAPKAVPTLFVLDENSKNQGFDDKYFGYRVISNDKIGLYIKKKEQIHNRVKDAMLETQVFKQMDKFILAFIRNFQKIIE